MEVHLEKLKDQIEQLRDQEAEQSELYRQELLHIMQKNYKAFPEILQSKEVIREELSDIKINFAKLENKISFLKDKSEAMKFNVDEIIRQGQGQESGLENIEELIYESIDTLNGHIYEKNYDSASKTLFLLKNMRQSKKFSQIFKKPEVKNVMELNYNSLIESLQNDYYQEFQQNKVIEIMKSLEEWEKLGDSFFLLKKKHLELMLQNQLEKYVRVGTEQAREIVLVFFKYLLDTNRQFNETFQESPQFLRQRAQITQWFEEACNILFEHLKSQVFLFCEFESAVDIVYEIFDTFQENQSNKLKLNFFFEEYFNQELSEKLDSQFEIYRDRIDQQESLTTQQIVEIFPVFGFIGSLDFCSDELEKKCTPKAKVNFTLVLDKAYQEQVQGMSALFRNWNSKDKLQQSSTSQQGNYLREKDYRDLLSESDLKGTTTMILFWNICYKFLDETVTRLSEKSAYKAFNCFYLILFQHKMQQFMRDYLSLVKEKINQNLVSLEEQDILSCNGVLYSMNLLAQTYYNYIVARLSENFPMLKMDSWARLIKESYLTLYDSLLSYFKSKLLSQIPQMFQELGYTYTQKKDAQSSAPQVYARQPHEIFVRIAALVENVLWNLAKIMRPKEAQIFLQKLILGIIFMLEYQIYWAYHDKGRVHKLFLSDIEEMKRFNFNFETLNQQLTRQCLRLGMFSLSGVYQIVFDIHFLSTFYNQHLINLEVGSEQFSSNQFTKKIYDIYIAQELKKQPATTFDHTLTAHSANVTAYIRSSYLADRNKFLSSELLSGKNFSVSELVL